MLALLLSTALNLGGSTLFSLIDYLWFSSVPVEFTHYQLRTVKNITNQQKAWYGSEILIFICSQFYY